MEINRIYCGDSRRMDEIDDNSVHLTITSPPYYVGKDYEGYLPTLESYFRMLRNVFQEVVRVTIPGGKICINLGDIAIGSKYNEGFPQEITVMSKLVEFLVRLDTYLYARIIWEKDDPWANSSHVTFHSKVQHAEYRILPAWEYLFVFRKGKEARKDKSPVDGRWIDKNEEWKHWVHGVWNIRSVQRNDYHEAMFPEELVRRCIKMYSFPKDIVFDPFMGSGVVAMVAKKLVRNYIGYELEQKYVDYANNRLAITTDEMIEKQKPYFDSTQNKKELEGDLFKGGGGIIE
jgi:site-specific DNA-methyltransferase (adenine-specific)